MSSMTKRRKLTFLAGGTAVAVLVVGLGSAGAIAASRMLSPSEESKTVIDDAAAQLGVQPEALSDALKQALKNRIDEAVADGRMTKEQATELKQRIDSGEYPPVVGRGGPGGRGFEHHGQFAILATAAAYLGMSEADLRAALDDQTLAEVAKKHGKTVDGLVKALVVAEEKKIDEAVADGRITKTQATEIKSNLTERMEALANGQLDRHRDGLSHEFFPGSRFPRGPPPAFGGPRA
jgi:polyhydroxyalkanoate synthesis regulator phasin